MNINPTPRAFVSPKPAARRLAFGLAAYALVPLYRKLPSQIAATIDAIALWESGGPNAKAPYNLYAVGPTGDYGVFQFIKSSSVFKVKWYTIGGESDEFGLAEFQSLLLQCMDFVAHQYNAKEQYKDVEPWMKRIAFRHHKGHDNEEYWKRVVELMKKNWSDKYRFLDLPIALPAIVLLSLA